MAGPLSASARLKSVKNDFGPTRGANAPDSWLAAIYDGNPEFDGVELTDAECPGYERIPIDSDDFADDGEGGMSVLVNDPLTATGPWTKDGHWVLLLNAADTSEAWDYTAIDRVRPHDDGTFDPLQISVFYSDDSTEPA